MVITTKIFAVRSIFLSVFFCITFHDLFYKCFRKGCPLPDAFKVVGFCPICPFRRSAWAHDNYKQAQAYRQHVRFCKHTDYSLGKSLWDCKKCGNSYTRKEQFENHPCERLKARDSDDPAVKYTRKGTEKKIHREAKIWTASVMYEVAFEENWCLPGTYLNFQNA